MTVEHALLWVTSLAVLPAWTLARRLHLDSLTTLSVAAVGGISLSFALQFGAYL